MNNWKHFLTWLVVSTLLFGGHFRAYLDPKVRHLKFVQGSDIFSLCLAILILAILGFLISRLLTLIGAQGKRWAELLFIVAFIQGLLVAIRPPADAGSALAFLATGIIWCLTTVVLWVHFRRPELEIAGRLSRITHLLSPLPLILVFQFLITPSVPPQSKATHWTQHEDATGSPIVIAIFDEWSVKQTFPDGVIPDWLPRLKELAGAASVYTDAHSAGRETILAMPRLLLQTTNFSETQLRHRLAPPTSPSLFDRAPDNYNRALIGFHLPYLTLLNGQLDSCQSYPATPKGEHLAQEILYHFWDFLIYWQDPWIESLRGRFFVPGPDKPVHIASPYWYELGRTIEDSAVQLLDRMPHNTISLFHFPFPHPPIVYASDGSYRRAGFNESDDPKAYKLNLLQVDRTVGRLIDTLKARSVWERTLLVLSSDHNWRGELIVAGRKVSTFYQELQHVPLIIKFPYQSEPRIFTNRFEMLDLPRAFQVQSPETSGESTTNSADREHRR